ncbi:hypothetical protein HK405_013235, partial [Cladochytrium tenue]
MSSTHGVVGATYVDHPRIDPAAGRILTESYPLFATRPEELSPWSDDRDFDIKFTPRDGNEWEDSDGGDDSSDASKEPSSLSDVAKEWRTVVSQSPPDFAA